MTPNCIAAQLLRSRSAIIFDLDGTLVDTLPDLTDALNGALADVGLPPVETVTVRRSLHGGLEGSVDAALALLNASADLHAATLFNYRRRYTAGLCERSRAYDGVPALLRQLREHGASLGICTNKPQAMAVELLDALDLLSGFEVVVGADTCGLRKPHPAPLRQAVAALRRTLPEAVLVGDSEVDRQCARAAPTASLLFDGGYGEFPPLEPMLQQARFDSYAHLLDALAAVNRLEQLT